MIAAERWPLVKAALPEATVHPEPDLPAELRQPVDPEQAAAALVRGRLDITGPVMAQKIAADLGLKLSTVEIALARLEADDQSPNLLRDDAANGRDDGDRGPGSVHG